MRILLVINLIATSTLFSSLVLFFLGYYFIEKPKQAQIEAEIRKIAAETARAELETKIKKIEASYAEKIHQLNTEQLNISNKLNLIESGIKESEREIAAITARHKLPRERSATLKEDTEAAGIAIELYTSISPKVKVNPLPAQIKNEDELITFISEMLLKNEGKFGVHIQTSVSVYLAHSALRADS